ncbi:transmembrane protein [Rhynchospora pubera]|uniref:Transmembrane protein n=1 Tax=Rhynchospora pubera TaxID=906938 RepID=A0AAV8EWC1_9POAL|nr:transmembrane protein [Rhynchospora pubera]KAJ4776841.1 transmembrane protein [Rhynchospora pubera]KAJ4783636.1 transmembrane protein [Rhynchospora pubera]KAJ4783639.1 transmembrane protein [Rhynchospora pubera]KAJ4804046.1 transmembrane protein [Rhynchospora pubera]
MAYYDRRHHSSIIDSFTLSPLPYPVILILFMVFFFLGVSSFFSFEDFMEEAEEQLSWILLAVPIVLIMLIKWLSSMDSFDGFLGFFYPNHRNQRVNYLQNDGGSSPWGVAALVVLVLILASFRSTFEDMWRP